MGSGERPGIDAWKMMEMHIPAKYMRPVSETPLVPRPSLCLTIAVYRGWSYTFSATSFKTFSRTFSLNSGHASTSARNPASPWSARGPLAHSNFASAAARSNA